MSHSTADEERVVVAAGEQSTIYRTVKKYCTGYSIPGTVLYPTVGRRRRDRTLDFRRLAG